MKAAVLETLPGELIIDEVAIATPGPGEVLVRTVAAGLCHSDLHFMENKYPYAVPAVLGHESAGVVEAVGEGVGYVQPGDHVITCLSVFCGQCEFCLSGRTNLCSDRAATQRTPGTPARLTRRGQVVNQFLDLSSFAEQMLVHQNAVVKVTKDVPLDRAALIGCAVVTGVGAVFKTARVPAGATVAVIGCGGVGLNCVQGAALAGASRVVAVDLSPAKLKLAEQFGATDLVDGSQGDAVQMVRELTGGGVEYSFEAIGLKATAEQSWKVLKAGGTATIIGMIPVGQMVEIHGPEFLAERRIQGSNMGSNHFKVDMPRLVDMYLQGRLKLDELVSARISLDEVNSGFESMKAGEVARSVIVFDA